MVKATQEKAADSGMSKGSARKNKDVAKNYGIGSERKRYHRKKATERFIYFFDFFFFITVIMSSILFLK